MRCQNQPLYDRAVRLDQTIYNAPVAAEDVGTIVEYLTSLKDTK
jgi:hypothetical protein